MTTPEEVFALGSLFEAARRAARGKGRRASVARFRLELEPELVRLHHELLDGSWRPSPPRILHVHDPKPRTISVLPFRDRVVHQALFVVLEPRLDRRMIRDTYACRPGFGTHAALARGRAWARTYRYWVRLDVQRYFPSLDHPLLRAQWRRLLPEAFLRELMDRILAAGVCDRERWHFPGDSLFAPYEREVGLPLGNLTSQLWANGFLSPVDHLVKDRLRHRAYLRYMDDLLLFHDDRVALRELARTVEEAALGLRLRLHPWDVQPTRDGVGLVGYRVYPRHVRVRRTTVGRAERRLARLVREVEAGRADGQALWDSLRSTFAHWDHASSWRLKGRVLRSLALEWPPLGDPDGPDGA